MNDGKLGMLPDLSKLGSVRQSALQAHLGIRERLAVLHVFWGRTGQVDVLTADSLNERSRGSVRDVLSPGRANGNHVFPSHSSPITHKAFANTKRGELRPELLLDELRGLVVRLPNVPVPGP